MSKKYLCDEVKDVTFVKAPVKRRGLLAPGQNKDGYGDSIAVDYMAVINKRKHRVYAICYSNVTSLYVLVKGERLIVRDYDIPEEVQKG